MICLRLPARQLAAILGGFSLAVMVHAAAHAADAPLVKIENFAFAPPALTVTRVAVNGVPVASTLITSLLKPALSRTLAMFRKLICAAPARLRLSSRSV